MNKDNFENLLFRRQFLVTPVKCYGLQHWKTVELDPYFIYAQNDSEITRTFSSDIHYLLIGFIIDPSAPGKTNTEILEGMAALSSLDEIPDFLYPLSGRYVIVIKTGNRIIVYHDPCGLRSVFYSIVDNLLYAASQPLLLEKVIPLERGAKYEQYSNSGYKRDVLENSLPTGLTLYDNVFQLKANHCLDTMQDREIRYWPRNNLSLISLEDGLAIFRDVMQNSIAAAHRRYKLSLPVTAGFDSRVILSMAKREAKDIFFYTLIYRHLDQNSPDVRIPRKLLKRSGFAHHIVDCKIPEDAAFKEIYSANSDTAHWNDWGKIAWGMYNAYPRDRVVLKGNCSEIARCYFYPEGDHPKIEQYEDVLQKLKGWDSLPFVKEYIKHWFDEIKSDDALKGRKILDVLYWEMRLAGWQGQSQLEWDIVQEVFSPYNNRMLMDILLGIDAKYRSAPDYAFYKLAIKNTWPELLSEPFNPEPLWNRIKSKVRRLLIKKPLKGGFFS